MTHMRVRSWGWLAVAGIILWAPAATGSPGGESSLEKRLDEQERRLLEVRREAGRIAPRVTDEISAEERTMWQCYRDKSRPFGHELCLVAMLRDDIPWLSSLSGPRKR